MLIAPISTEGLGKKQQANMASMISTPIPLDEFVRRIEQRKADTGIIDLPRNGGNRRTASKRALLKAIEDIGGKW